jgi:5-methylthioadenosine/S-adenosylhomocysteine deaminase
MSILIKNPWVVTQNRKREILRKDVYIDDGRIVEIADSINAGAEFRIDGAGKILMPGLVNTHTHIAMGFARGLVDDIDLSSFLERTFKLDAERTRDEIYYGSLLGMAESVRFGTTTILDLFYGEDVVAEAAKKSGIRALLAWVALDKEFTTQKGVPLENADSFIRGFGKHPLVEPTVGLQGIYVCSDETMLKGMDIAKRHGKVLPMHVSETEKEVRDCERKTGERPIEHMSKIGFLSPHLVSIHSTHVTPGEVAMLKRNGVKISHNPVSNLKLGSGEVAPIKEYLENGLTVSLGTDSVASNNNLDMFQMMKCAALLQKNKHADASVIKAQEALDFATIGGAKALNKENEIGSIEQGKRADVILVDPSFNGLPLSRGNIVSNIVYSLGGMNTEATIVDGELLMQDRRLRIDTKELEKYLKKD